MVLQTQLVAQNAEAASFSAASFFRTAATTAILVNIDSATAANFSTDTHHGCRVLPDDVIDNILIAPTPDLVDSDAGCPRHHGRQCP